MNFVNITGGEFLMGASLGDEEALDQEKPAKLVSVQSFHLAEHLVTISQFGEFIEATQYEPASSAVFFDGEDWQMGEELCWNDPGYSYMDDTPVTCVNFQDVMQFIEWKSKKDGIIYRLPSEAEWEFAARAGTTSSRFWGDRIEDGQKYANAPMPVEADDPKFNYASPVGWFSPNPWGLYDMLGNVFEWTGSDYVDTFDGQESICSSNDEFKTYRGGSFNSDSSTLRCSARAGFPGQLANNQLGFRLAKEK